MKLNLLIFLSLLLTLYSIETDFDIIYNTNSEGQKFINLINDIYTEIEISFGLNLETFKLRLDLSNYCTVIPGIEFNNSKIKMFNKSSSTTFEEVDKFATIYFENFYSGVVGKDKIKIGKNEPIDNMKFIVASSYSIYQYYSYFGLDFKSNQVNLFGLNFLEQLKSNSIIDKQIWYLEFKDNNKGKFIIGKLPHEVNNKKYNKNDIRSTYLNKTSSFYSFYKIKFDEIYYGKSNNYNNRVIMKEHNDGEISLSTKLIYSTYEFGETIYKNFFKIKIEDKICFREKINSNKEYLYFYCLKDKIKMNEMENLNFVIKDNNMTFTFSPKELFYEHEKYLYYLVVYKPYNEEDTDKDTEWYLGLHFLQKYTLAFDRQEQIVYYYIPKNNNGNEKSNKSTTIYIIIIILLVVIFLVCIGTLVYYIIKIKPRKKKANELDEGYDYETKKNENNGNDPFLIN